LVNAAPRQLLAKQLDETLDRIVLLDQDSLVIGLNVAKQLEEV
jgi:hypothetical protein